jgi:hypothetical protein
VKKSFDFEDAGRIFSCRMEQARSPNTAAWWWFTVSSDGHRYAPFHFDATTDTEESVRTRIVQFYDNRIAQRDAPRQPWRRPEPAAVPPAAPNAGDAPRAVDAAADPSVAKGQGAD